MSLIAQQRLNMLLQGSEVQWRLKVMHREICCGLVLHESLNCLQPTLLWANANLNRLSKQ